jgi:hypothetical protein
VDQRAAAADLPPLDSLNVWPLLSGANTTSPRTEIPLSTLPGEEFLCSAPMCGHRCVSVLSLRGSLSWQHPRTTGLNGGWRGLALEANLEPGSFRDPCVEVTAAASSAPSRARAWLPARGVTVVSRVCGADLYTLSSYGSG